MLSVSVWDRSMVKAVEQAIRESHLGLNPIIEGQNMRIPLLNSTKSAQVLVKVAHEYAEKAKVATRHVRRDGMDSLKRPKRTGRWVRTKAVRLRTRCRSSTTTRFPRSIACFKTRKEKSCKCRTFERRQIQFERLPAERTHFSPDGTSMIHGHPVASRSTSPSSWMAMADGHSSAGCRNHGHRKASKRLREIVRVAGDAGISYLTHSFCLLFRELVAAETEVNDLMGLLKAFIRRDLAELHAENVRIRVIVSRENLRGDILPLLLEAEETTRHKPG